MLSHTIVVEKPHILIPTTPPINYHAHQGANLIGLVKNINSQHDLDVFLETKAVVGQVVVYARASGIQTPNDFHQLHYVSRICNDIAELGYDGAGHGKTHFMIQMDGYDRPNPWNRWCDPTDFRNLYESERSILGAQLQNRLNLVKAFVEANS